MSHPEFLKQKFGKARVQGAQRPCWGAGCPRKNPFFARRLRRRAGREKRGTAPHPSPLQSRLSSHLMRVEPMFEKFGMTHVRGWERHVAARGLPHPPPTNNLGEPPQVAGRRGAPRFILHDTGKRLAV